MKKIDLVHIYSGTSGIAGLYIHAIYKNLKNQFSQETIVNAYFPFDYGRKIFYRFSDLSVSNNYFLKGKIRLCIKFIEMFYSFVYILIFIRFNSVKSINYSLNTTLKIEVLFLKVLKKISDLKVFVTCHEVIPHWYSVGTYEKILLRRQKIFSIVDKLIVHNQFSKNELYNYFGIKSCKVLMFPFPIMDAKDIYRNISLKNSSCNKNFIFIGHFRKEKGLEVLIDAWDIFFDKCYDKNISLTLAGNIPQKDNIEFQKILNKNVILKTTYLSDLDYINLINISDCVILPYDKGTNTGIASTAITLGKFVIASDIPLFKTNPLLFNDLLFKQGNPIDLCKVLIKVFHFDSNEIDRYKNETMKKIDLYNNEFKYQINNVFKKELL